jgi:hypothetical protein
MGDQAGMKALRLAVVLALSLLAMGLALGVAAPG